MNEEIKEILESLDKIAKGDYYPEDLLYYENCQKLLDYITNLRQENEQLRTALNGSEEARRKAIEYINHSQNYGKEKSIYINGDDLLKILGGDE